jgi:hypothetical protein
MSSSAGPSLNEHSLPRAKRLARRRVVADVFIVGGAMALAYDADRVTRDVDAEEARRVADDLGKRRVFDHPGLRVMAASPDHIFAMKALAARTRVRLMSGCGVR